MNKILAAINTFAKTYPDRIALRGECEQLSYAELAKRVNQLADWLLMRKIQRAGLWGENSIEWIIADLAAWKADITLVPLAAFASPAQVQYVVSNAQLKSIISLNNIHQVSMASHRELSPIQGIYLDEVEAVQMGEKIRGVCKITFTSGTTGTPKGVCLSTEAIESVALGLAERIYANPATKDQINQHINMLPLGTLLENIAGVYVPLFLGKTVITLAGSTMGLTGSSQLSVPQLLKTLTEYQPNSLILLPQILQGLVAACSRGYGLPSSLKFVAVGGGKTPAALIKQARALGIPVYEGYGLSECASVVSLNAATDDLPGSVGKPLSNKSVKIENGVIKVRNSGFYGYLGQETPDFDDWIDTGDIGYLDENGYLYITGRKKNLLISSFGRNISPEWIEAELSINSNIRHVMVVGDDQPYCAAIIVTASTDTDVEAIRQYISSVNKTLPDYARIQKFILTNEAFSVANQLLTENGRLRRAQIISFYQQAIESLYSSQAFSSHAGAIYDIF